MTQINHFSKVSSRETDKEIKLLSQGPLKAGEEEEDVTGAPLLPPPVLRLRYDAF